jgi:hypothetical protein
LPPVLGSYREITCASIKLVPLQWFLSPSLCASLLARQKRLYRLANFGAFRNRCLAYSLRFLEVEPRTLEVSFYHSPDRAASQKTVHFVPLDVVTWPGDCLLPVGIENPLNVKPNAKRAEIRLTGVRDPVNEDGIS